MVELALGLVTGLLLVLASSKHVRCWAGLHPKHGRVMRRVGRFRVEWECPRCLRVVGETRTDR